MNTATESKYSIGIHPAIQAADYHAFHACNNSSLNTLKARSPLHVKHERENPCEQTEAMMLGSAMHTWVLEPALFDRQYTIAGNCGAILKSGKRKGACCGNGGVHRVGEQWLCGKHASEGDSLEGVLTSEQFASLLAMHSSITADSKCSRALAVASARETTLIWNDENTGVLCKARLDAWSPKAGIIVDIKTTTDASEDTFTRTIYDRGYHRQAAHYIAGAAALGVSITDYILIAVEKDAPHASAFCRLTDEAIEAGAKELRPLIERYSHCENLNLWPGYDARDIGIPAWKAKQIENNL